MNTTNCGECSKQIGHVFRIIHDLKGAHYRLERDEKHDKTTSMPRQGKDLWVIVAYSWRYNTDTIAEVVEPRTGPSLSVSMTTHQPTMAQPATINHRIVSAIPPTAVDDGSACSVNSTPEAVLGNNSVHVPRPLNSFMLFRQFMIPHIQAENPGVTMAVMCKTPNSLRIWLVLMNFSSNCFYGMERLI